MDYEDMLDSRAILEEPTPYANQYQVNFATLSIELNLPDANGLAALCAGGKMAETYLSEVQEKYQRSVNNALRAQASGRNTTYGKQTDVSPAWFVAQIEAQTAWLRYAGHLLREHPKSKMPSIERLQRFVRLIRDSDWRTPVALERLMKLGRLTLACYGRRRNNMRRGVMSWQAEHELRKTCREAHAQEVAASASLRVDSPGDRPAQKTVPRWERTDHQPFTDWAQLKIAFVDKDTVQVGGKPYTFDACGFGRAQVVRSVRPYRQAWFLLAALAVHGSLPRPSSEAERRSLNRLRRHLRDLTGLSGNPLPYDRETGFCAPAFVIEDRTRGGAGGALLELFA